MNGIILKIMYEVEHIDWEEIKKVWELELWPDKKGGVKKVNNWTWFHPSTSLSQDKGIEKNEFGIPYFFGIKIDNVLVCVNSCFKTSTDHPFAYKNESYWRSRGLWTSPKYRKLGLASEILNHTTKFVGKKKASWLWTVPRQSALSAYEQVGFVKIGDWFEYGQYGPNCIASKYL